MLFLLYFLLATCPVIFPNQLSLAEIDGILLNRNMSQSGKEKYITPMLSAIKTLESKEAIDINFKLAPICRIQRRKQECKDNYIPFNPSIMKTDEGYIVVCRTTDHYLGTEQIPGALLETKMRYDKDFKLTYEQEIPTINDDLARNISKYHQIEDCRLFNWNGKPWIAGTVLVPKKMVAVI